MVGRTISHYRIISQLGAGGMGVVYAADDQRLGRPVALKFVPDDLAKDQKSLERLRSEARRASALNHANICTIYDIDEYEGRPFIVMELLKGQTVRERLTAGPLKIHEIVDIAIQIADALDWSHANGIIHRDIKPANLFLVDRGRVKVVDFGLAKQLPLHPAAGTTGGPTTELTVAGMTLGTVAYMSPEQIAGDDLDGRTDLFSVGVVLYELVTGHQPFTGKTSGVVLATILNHPPVPPIAFNPELPLHLQEVINKCLEKDRELRYQNAGDLRADLKRIKRDLESGHVSVMRAAGAADLTAIGAVPPSSGSTSALPHAGASPVPHSASGADRRSSAGTIAAIVAAVVVVLAAGGAYVLRRPAPAATVASDADQADARVKNGLESAGASLRARDYRAALAQAEEVLSSAPNQAEAMRIRDEARAEIARFDEAVARARSLLASGDADGASNAIDTARAIDPASPALGDLSARLVDQFRARAESARRASPAQPPPAPARAVPPPSSTDTARRDTQRPPVATEPQNVPSTSGSQAAPPPATSAQTVAPSVSTTPPAPAPAASASQPASPPAAPTPATPSASATASATPPPASDTDDSAIRRVVATYARAIETKDVALFRSIKPNMSPQEQRRIEEGFRAVASQRVTITILAIERHDQEALVRLRRSDTIDAGGRQQTSESQQTMTLARTGTTWTIREIGR